ncbi:hypothetical protein KL918_003630 [Ogataea parapolymorpha]|nr:hypothetical protein KL918_003630 [Ogataea parapolymorpha]KAG7871298.1 hypothetical protein KL916_004093 [Ogataea parapolymorpha]
MLRREPTTIKLTPDDVKEFYREQTYNTISGSSEPAENQNLATETQQRSIKERILGERGRSHESSGASEKENEYQPNKRAARKPNKTSRGPKRRKTVPNNIDQLENFQENPIFETLSHAEVAVAELAASWLDQFEEDKYDAVKDMLNFVLRACGCVTLVAKHDVANADSSKETVAEIQAMFEKQGSHEYPLGLAGNSKNANWRDFKKRCLEFVDQVLVAASEQGILYEDDELVELLVTWLGALTTSNARPLRYASTLLCLQMETTLCSLVAQTSTAVNRAQRQLTNEQRNIDNLLKKARSGAKLAAAKDRAAQIEQNCQLYSEHKTYLETFLQDIFNTTFAHRYRDTDAQIRQECVRHLSYWIDLYPEFFFESIYIRYLGWLMTDQDVAVRHEVLRVVLRLYQTQSMVAALRQFTSHFKEKLIEMAFYEADTRVRSSCVQVLTEISRMGFLDTEEVVKVASLIFVDDEDLICQKGKTATRLIKDLAKFIATVEAQSLAEFMESNSATVEKVAGSLELSVKDLLKFHGVSQMLVEAETYYNSDVATKAVKMRSYNSRTAKLVRVCQNLFALPRYHADGALETLCGYILYDFSANAEIAKIQHSVELSHAQTFFVLGLISAAATIYCEADANEFHQQLFPKKHDDQTNDRMLYLGKLVAQLDSLFDVCKKTHLAVFLGLFTQLVKHRVCETLDQTETETKITAQLLKTFREDQLSSYTPESPEYYNSINFQFAQLFEHINTDMVEVSLKVDEVAQELAEELTLAIKDADRLQVGSTLCKLMLLRGSATKSRLLTQLMPLIDDICSCTASLPLSDELDQLVASNKASEYFSCLLFLVAENLETLTNKLKVDPDAEVLDELHRHLSPLAPVKRALLELVASRAQNINFWYAVCNLYLDVFTTLNLLKYYVGPHRDVLDHFFDTEMSVEPLSSSQECLLQLFLILEAQVASEKQVELDRTEHEDVNFETAQMDDCERKLCTFVAKLMLLDKTVGLETSIVSRVKLNRAVLGSLFNEVLDYEQVEMKEEEELPKELPQEQQEQQEQQEPLEQSSDQFLHTNTSVPNLLPEPVPDLVL